MIDVHAPEHRISGRRDFFVHLFTISIGLLIALGLENAAEAWHHRHQRTEAEETIRQELEENKAHMVQAQQAMHKEAASLDSAMLYLRERGAGQEAPGAKFALGFSVVQLQDSAWRTANATGVLQYMDYRAVQKLAQAYAQQETFNALQSETLKSYLLLNSHVIVDRDPAKMTVEDVKEAMPDARNTMTYMNAMNEVSQQVVEGYKAALGGK